MVTILPLPPSFLPPSCLSLSLSLSISLLLVFSLSSSSSLGGFASPPLQGQQAGSILWHHYPNPLPLPLPSPNLQSCCSHAVSAEQQLRKLGEGRGRGRGGPPPAKAPKTTRPAHEAWKTAAASMTSMQAHRPKAPRCESEQGGAQRSPSDYLLAAFTSVLKTVWPSGLRRWLKAPVRKGVGSNPTAVNLSNAAMLASILELPKRL